MRKIRFVRLLRNELMEFGYAIDIAGKLWCGFNSNWDDKKVQQEGQLGPVGLCCCCDGRVFSGWTCLSEKKDFTRDIHTSCVILPEQEKIFTTEFDLKTKRGNEDFNRLAEIFKRRPDFICPVAS